MDSATHVRTAMESASSTIRFAFPSSWLSSQAYSSRFLFVAPFTSTLLANLLPLVFFWILYKYGEMQDEYNGPFPFLDLPQELRDMVYANLMEDPVYPPPAPCTPQQSSIWSIPVRRSPSTSLSIHKSNWLFLANKQIYAEFMDMLCKTKTFHLTVSPQNYEPPVITPPSIEQDISPTPVTKSSEKIWNIAPEILKSIRTASLKLITTSAMLGVADPRNMTSTDWVLARQIHEELKHLTNVTDLTLDAKAIGDPLWTPLWIWYHASQSFKTMGTSASETDPIGPKLNRITFSLDTWSPGENYIERDEANKGAWKWYCMKGHSVGLDIGAEMTVREFCGKLYQDCKVCRPEWEDGEGDA